MDAKDVTREKPRFAPPIARAGKTGEDKMNEEDKMEVRKEVSARKTAAGPGKRRAQARARLSNAPTPGERNTGGMVLGNVGAVVQSEKEGMSQTVTLKRREEEVLPKRTDAGRETGAEVKKQKPKNRVKGQGTDSHNRVAVGKERAKSKKTRNDKSGKMEDVQKNEKRTKKRENGQVMKKGRENREGGAKAQLLTDTQYDKIFESVLESSTLNLMKDAKAMLTEVELMHARLELETCRAERKGGGGEESSAAPSLQGKQERGSKIERQKEMLHVEERSTDLHQYVLWVQCSRAECGKWRRISEDVDPSVLPDDWICDQNSDPRFSSCLSPEETVHVREEEHFFCHLVPGSLVWVQQSGYPWWPAVIERDPDSNHYLEFRKESDLTPYRCHVTYLGDPVCRAWVPCTRVKDYADLSEEDAFNMLRQQHLKKKLKDAVRISKQALKLPLKRRLVSFGFWTRYVSERESSEEDSDIAEFLSLFGGKTGNSREYCSDEDVHPEKQRRWLKRREGRCGGKSSLSEREREKSRMKKGHERKGEKEGVMSEQKKQKRLKKILEMKKKRERARQEAVADPIMVKEEKKPPTPSFCLPKKDKPTKKTDTAELHDQTVPQSTMETTLITTQEMAARYKGKQKGGVAEHREEDGLEREGEEGGEGEGNQVEVERWEFEFGDEEETAPMCDYEDDDDEEGGFLDTDMKILACRDEVLKHLYCKEEEEGQEEEQSDFSLMLLEE